MTKLTAAAAALLLLVSPNASQAEDVPAMFGVSPARNMMSNETGLPTEWDIDSGKNIKWQQKLGSQTYAGPSVYKDWVFVGTNNEGERIEGLTGDKGVIMGFRASDGEFMWQATHDKLGAGRVNDWPLQGVCSTPYIENDRVYYLSNRAEMVAADLLGFSNGNDGFNGESYTGPQDADILWAFDTIGELDNFPHNLAASSPLIVGDLVYVTTGNGVDEGHLNIPSPLGPSFIAVDKNTGELAWESALPGENILHGTWSNPTYGEAGGRAQVIFPGGDGWLYSFVPQTGELIWKFDTNPKDSRWELGGSGTRNNIISTAVFHDGKVYIGVGQDPEHGEGPGHFYAIDASGTGDISSSGQVWHFGDDDFNRTISTAAIAGDMLYITDLSGFLYALELATGKHLWTHDTFAAVWGSPFVADGKIYLGDEDGDIVILEAGREEKIIAEMNMGGAVYTTPVARDGVLYIATRADLFAIETE
ncbi:MAG: PQQ-binding-like beta-propeller repeat protein [Acidobacteriota bacterium]|nr:PQQ-binding-like beta-propeller repeat protein [Acidobacteriota bacterium]